MNGNPVPVSSSLSNANQTLTLVALATLSPGTQYALTVSGVTDPAGNPMSPPFTSSFTTGVVDFSSPTVLSVLPANGTTGVLTSTTIQIQFSKLVNPLTITHSTFTVSTGNSLVPGTVSILPNGTGATFTPTSHLAISTTYTIYAAAGIQDLEGQSLSNFQTGTQ